MLPGNEGKARLLYNVPGARSCFRNAVVKWGRAGWWDSAAGLCIAMSSP